MKTLFEQFNDILENEDEQIHDYLEYESCIKTLCEKDGYKLVFGDTPGHGYFGYVYKNGRLIIIGEEDDGIQDERIMKFFGVDKYGQK